MLCFGPPEGVVMAYAMQSNSNRRGGNRGAIDAHDNADAYDNADADGDTAPPQ